MMTDKWKFFGHASASNECVHNKISRIPGLQIDSMFIVRMYVRERKRVKASKMWQ